MALTGKILFLCGQPATGSPVVYRNSSGVWGPIGTKLRGVAYQLGAMKTDSDFFVVTVGVLEVDGTPCNVALYRDSEEDWECWGEISSQYMTDARACCIYNPAAGPCVVVGGPFGDIRADEASPWVECCGLARRFLAGGDWEPMPRGATNGDIGFLRAADDLY